MSALFIIFALALNPMDGSTRRAGAIYVLPVASMAECRTIKRITDSRVAAQSIVMAGDFLTVSECVKAK